MRKEFERLIKSCNRLIQDLSMEEQMQMALQWRFDLMDQAALARMMPALPESARLGILPALKMMGFMAYTLHKARVYHNHGFSFDNDDMTPRPTPSIAPRLTPQWPPRPTLVH